MDELHPKIDTFMSTPDPIRPSSIVNDPLLTRIPLEFEATFFPYGFPVRIRSNSKLTIDAADRSWSTYSRQYDHPPLDVRLLLSESASPAGSEEPTFRSQGHLLTIVVDRENFACLDLEAGFAFGWATEATARNQEYFRQCLLDVMIYPLLEIQHLITLHAACVQYQGKGILLAGNSGAGKSSLSYACARRGWTFVSDDASAFLRSAPSPTIIGHPQKFRFREPVGTLFPEFLGLKSTLRAYGKPTIEVRTDKLTNIQRAGQSGIGAIVFLNRPAYDGNSPSLIPMPIEQAWEKLSYSVWAIQMPAFDERLNALKQLLDVPIYELRYSEFDPAIELLQQLAKERVN
jgi:hypothetical protein